MLAYNERAGLEFRAEFEDASGAPALPSTVHWNLWCETTRTQLQPDTPIDPVAVVGDDGITRYSVTVNVPGTLNTIRSKRNVTEQKKLLVIANKDQVEEFSQEHVYVVRNLRGRD